MARKRTRSLTDIQNTAKARSQLFIKQAVIYDNMNINSDMLKVRVLPEMIGYNEKDLPNYSCFNPQTVIKGVSEKDAGSVDKATKIWVACTQDMLVGWVMMEANDQYAPEDTSAANPWGFGKFKEQLLRCHLNVNSAEYSELKVLFNNSKNVSLYQQAGIGSSKPATAVGLDVVNVRTGERFFMLQSGTTFALQQDSIYMRVGSPDADVSFFHMTPNNIELTANQVVLYGREKTSLGKHGFQVVGMLGAPTAIDGSPLVPILDMTC